MTQADKSQRPWDGERRHVNADFLREYVEDFTTPIFYLAGPPALVEAVTNATIEAGADPERVHSEEFWGY